MTLFSISGLTSGSTSLIYWNCNSPYAVRASWPGLCPNHSKPPVWASYVISFLKPLESLSSASCTILVILSFLGNHLRYLRRSTNGYVTLEHYSKQPYGSLIKLSIASIMLASVFMNIFALTSTESVSKPSNTASTPYDSLSATNIPLCDLCPLTPGCLTGLFFTTESTRPPPTLSSTLSESPVVILNECKFDSTG